MTIQFIDPRAEPGATPEPYDLSVDVTGGQTIGLLANGFPDSVRFLDYLQKSLAARLPDLKIKRYNKGNATVVASDQVLSGIAKECLAVITAYGH
jgi:hypothetical protein